jgi:hypothetical protein
MFSDRMNAVNGVGVVESEDVVFARVETRLLRRLDAGCQEMRPWADEVSARVGLGKRLVSAHPHSFAQLFVTRRSDLPLTTHHQATSFSKVCRRNVHQHSLAVH